MTPEQLRIAKEKFNALARRQREQREAEAKDQRQKVINQPKPKTTKHQVVRMAESERRRIISDGMKAMWAERKAPDGYIGTADIERIYGRPRSGIQAATRRGRLSPIYEGRVAYYKPEDIERYINEARDWRKRLGSTLARKRWKDHGPGSSDQKSGSPDAKGSTEAGQGCDGQPQVPQ